MGWFRKKGEKELRRAFFHALPLFEGIPRGSRAFRLFLDRVELVGFPRTSVVYRNGDEPAHVYIVRDGEIRITHPVRRREEDRLIAIQGRGSLFGESSFMNGERHNTTAIAALDSTLYRIPGQELLNLLSREPSVGEALARILSRRLSNRIQSLQEIPASVFTILYPENTARGNRIARALCETLHRETPTPGILFDFCEKSTVPQKRRGHIPVLLERWPKLTIDELHQLFHEKGFACQILEGSSIYDERTSVPGTLEMVPALLGFLKNYYGTILVDGGAGIEHPAVQSLLAQSDRIILIRSLESGDGAAKAWKAVVDRCRRLLPDFNERLITVTDERNGIKLSPADLRTLDPLIAESIQIFRTHLRIHSSPSREEHEDPLFREGVERLARRLTGRSRGLALGGGGARALAHLGALEVMESDGIRFDAVAGSSMGAILGAGYALGLRAREIRYIIRHYIPNSKAILDKQLPLESFFRGDKIRVLLENFFKDMRFEDLELPFYCCGSDLDSGKLVIFQKGLLVPALRATVSLPGVFPPMRIDGLRVVDGGVLNNLPGSVLKKRGYRKVIGINVSPGMKSEEPILKEGNGNRGWIRHMQDYLNVPPILKIISRAVTVQSNELLRQSMDDFDFVIHPDVGNYEVFDFHRLDAIVESGRMEAVEHLADIKDSLK